MPLRDYLATVSARILVLPVRVTACSPVFLEAVLAHCVVTAPHGTFVLATPALRSPAILIPVFAKVVLLTPFVVAARRGPVVPIPVARLLSVVVAGIARRVLLSPSGLAVRRCLRLPRSVSGRGAVVFGTVLCLSSVVAMMRVGGFARAGRGFRRELPNWFARGVDGTGALRSG